MLISFLSLWIVKQSLPGQAQQAALHAGTVDDALDVYVPDAEVANYMFETGKADAEAWFAEDHPLYQ